MKSRSTYKVITDEVRAIRALRERRGLSVNKAALIIGTNKSTLTALENGRINLSEDWILRMLNAYKCTLNEFNKFKKEDIFTKEEIAKSITESLIKLSSKNIKLIQTLVEALQ